MLKNRRDIKRATIGLRSLKSAKVLFEGDIYDLACFLLKAYNAKDQVTHSRSRPTVHGIATRYSILTDISTDAIIEIFNAYGLPLGAAVEPDDEDGATSNGQSQAVTERPNR